MKKYCLTLALFLLCAMTMYAQISTEKIQQELNSWMAAKKSQPLPADIEKMIVQQAAVTEPGKTLTAAEQKKQIEDLRAFYTENMFWRANPDYENSITKRLVGNGENLCNNGGFENGNTAFTHFGSGFSGGSNNCTFVNSMAWNPTIASSAANNVANRMQVVTGGSDPVVPGLSRTRNGNGALRINSHLNASGGSCSSYGAQVDKAATTFVVDARSSTLTFWYAVVMQNPSHAGSGGQNPFFTARVRNESTGALIQQICFDPSQNNLQAGGTNCNSNILWQPWTCATFNLSQFAGQRVTLEFIAADCGAGAHYGYAYIDDICTGCNTLGNNGALTIASNDNCFTNGISFNGTFSTPPTPGATLQSLTVQLRRNGTTLTSITPTITGNTYTGTVPASFFTNGTAYDLIAVATFNVPGMGQVITTTEIQPGINNDFTAVTTGCCDPNDSPGFTISTACNNGVFSVTVTATDLDPTGHQWYLMETNVAGNTTNGATVGQIGAIQYGTTTTFTITDLNKFYYIKHGIMHNCYTWKEERTPIQTPQAANVFNFEDADGAVKNTFCFGEDVYLDGTASTGEASYFIDAWRRPIGSTTAFTWYGSLGWFQGQAGIINLSQSFRSLATPVYFEPGYEYSIKLALENRPNCIGWTPREQAFKVICCTDYIKPNYLLDITPAATSYSLTAQGFTTYANINAVHEWYVLSSPNQTGGPYTPVTSLSSTTQTTVPLFSNAQYGLFYTVIHKVRTKCGDVCIKRVQYQSGLSKSAIKADTSASQVDCCLAFQFWPNGPGTQQQFTAAFQLGANPLSAGQYTINTSGAFSYSNNPSVTHEWFVLSSPNATGGPYTSILQATGYNFSYAPAADGLHYFIIHRVKSPCGMVCYGQSICRNCNALPKAACQLCGPIDCSILDTVWKPCTAPINLKSDCRRNVLSWDAVSGFPTYAVEINFNDAACCNTTLLPSSNIYNATTNSLSLTAIRVPQYDCFRWRVMIKCDNGKEAWSAWQCFSCTAVIAEPGPKVIQKQ
jgi:hypothetical protein